jgi:hypothetical protein
MPIKSIQTALGWYKKKRERKRKNERKKETLQFSTKK